MTVVRDSNGKVFYDDHTNFCGGFTPHQSCESLKEFYDKYYGPNNATLVLAGDFDTEDAKALAILQFKIAKHHEQLEEFDEAKEAYEKAVFLDRDFADAHYNLSCLCERTGQSAMALRHLLRYKALTR